MEKHFDNFRIDIGEVQPARLPSLSFEGATKRNKPNLAIGTLMYCVVVMANKDMEVKNPIPHQFRHSNCLYVRRNCRAYHPLSRKSGLPGNASSARLTGVMRSTALFDLHVV